MTHRLPQPAQMDKLRAKPTLIESATSRPPQTKAEALAAEKVTQSLQ